MINGRDSHRKAASRAGVENVSRSYSDAPKRSVPDKAPFIFYEGGEDMEKQLRKAKDRCFMYGLSLIHIYLADGAGVKP